MVDKTDFYYIIHNSEDGISIDQVTREELLKRLQPEEPDNPASTQYGAINIISFPGKHVDIESLHEHDLIILKGTSIIPVPKKVVTAWEVE